MENIFTLSCLCNECDHVSLLSHERKFPKQIHEHTPPSSALSPKISEQFALAINNGRPASGRPQTCSVGRSDSNQKNEINCHVSALSSSSRNKNFSSGGNSPGESLISLLKSTDIYIGTPGVVSSVSNQSLASFPHHRQPFKLNL